VINGIYIYIGYHQTTRNKI